MNNLVDHWTLNADTLAWSATILVQVTLLAGLALVWARLAKTDGFLACILSVVLFANLEFPDRLAVAQPPLTQVSSLTSDKENNWIRGTGDELEFRLRGRLIGSIDGYPVDPEIEVRIFEPSRTIPAEIVGDSYDVWVPEKGSPLVPHIDHGK